MLRSSLVSLVATAVLLAPAAAQTARPFPMQTAGTDARGLQTMSPDPTTIFEIQRLPTLELAGFEMRSGEVVDLALQRIDLDRLGFQFQVNGLDAPGLLDGLDLSVWTGDVIGKPGSEVVLSFSNHGTRGWVNSGTELVHLLPQPDAVDGWARSHSIVASDEELLALGMSVDDFCGLDTLDSARDTSEGAASGLFGKTPGQPPQGIATLGVCSFFEAKIAIETDFQLFQVFNDLGAETAYITTLLAAVSARYEDQIDTILTYPYVQFYTTAGDPWSTPDGPGSSSAMLNEFVAAWTGNLPASADIGHFVSGASLGGGIAYLGILCDASQSSTFAVSGNLAGQTPFPISVSPLNWDFMVFAHETGHNFNSPHTHDYSPQIDNCAGGTCITNGTLMSYCHLCSGGLSNVTTFFNTPTVTNVMIGHATACLPFFTPLSAAAAPALIAPDSAFPVSVTVQGTPVGNVNLNYRFDPGDGFTVVAMSTSGGGVYTASLPSLSCADQPEWFFSSVDSQCGPFSTTNLTSEVGFTLVSVDEQFEAGSGWTVGSGADTATTGIWTLGNPLGTGAQPEDDHTPGGTDCFFTGQGTPGGGLGEEDIDNGQTTLTSPVYDLSGSPDGRISYWRWYSNDTSAAPNEDIFVVDISNDGGSNWVNAETVGPSGPGTGGGWFFHQFNVSDFVAPTASVQLRFIASDNINGSLVEAAIDDLQVFRVECSPWEDLGGGTTGVNGAPLLVMGGPLTDGSLMTIDLSQAAPSALSVMFFSLSSSPVSFLGGTLSSFPIDAKVFVPTDVSGAISASLPIVSPIPGVEMWVQFAIVDGSVPGFGASLSNGVKGSFP
jgi:hypothetical protein